MSLQGTTLRNAIIEQEGVIRHWAWYYHRKFYSFRRLFDVEDLMQAARLGMMEAFPRFDPNRGARLDTFLEKRIRGAMIDEVRRLSWVIGSNRTKNPVRSEPEPYDFNRLRRYRKARSPEDFTVDKERLAHALGNGVLDEREKRILRFYFVHGATMREIGELLGVTESRISQLIGKCLDLINGDVSTSTNKRAHAEAQWRAWAGEDETGLRQLRAVTGMQVARRRKELGWTQARLAKMMGVSAALVSQWETGKLGIYRYYWPKLHRWLEGKCSRAA